MNYKMIATDLDRTLLRTDKTVSEYTLDVLGRCQKAGVKVAIASARNYTAVVETAEMIRCDGVVSGNGAVMRVGDWEYVVPMDRKVGETLIHQLREAFPDTKIIAIISERVYSTFEYHNYHWIKDPIVTDFAEIPEGNITKVTIWQGSEEDDRRLQELIPESCYATLAVGALWQVMDKRATKWQGVCALAEHWGIRPDEIIAFGDDIDDICMLEGSGHGVAMINSLPAVLENAKYVTEYNHDQDGVARYLEKVMWD
ncbi:MAG: HAD family hydrolase [Lachnospiraceae bacterium]|nr:HAD family hydrolase [Lachnospiraceae bacterium]